MLPISKYHGSETNIAPRSADARAASVSTRCTDSGDAIGRSREADPTDQVAAFAREFQALQFRSRLDIDGSAARREQGSRLRAFHDETFKALDSIIEQLSSRTDPEAIRLLTKCRVYRASFVRDTGMTAQRKREPPQLPADPLAQVATLEKMLERTAQDIKNGRNAENRLQFVLIERVIAPFASEVRALRHEIEAIEGKTQRLSPAALQQNIDKTADLAEAYGSLSVSEPACKAVFDVLDQLLIMNERHPIPFSSEGHALRRKIATDLHKKLGRIRLAQLNAAGLRRSELTSEKQSNFSINPHNLEHLRVMLADIRTQLDFGNAPTFANMQRRREIARRKEIAVLLSTQSDDEITEELGKCFSSMRLRSDYYDHVIRLASVKDNEKTLSDSDFAELQKFIKPSGPAKVKAGKKLSKKPASADVSPMPPPTEEVDPASVSLAKQIALKQAHRSAPQQFEANVARITRDICERQLTSFAKLTGFNVILRNDERVLAEFDVQTNVAIIEATLRSNGKYRQLEKRALNKDGINPTMSPTILVAPNYTDAAIAELRPLQASREAASVIVVRTEDELYDVLCQLDDELFATTAKNIGFA